jgi:hypothetical protein
MDIALLSMGYSNLRSIDRHQVNPRFRVMQTVLFITGCYNVTSVIEFSGDLITSQNGQAVACLNGRRNRELTLQLHISTNHQWDTSAQCDA